MNFVMTVRYRICVNGELTDEIIPQRGLRQGDPLSPYLFLICAEVFSCMLNAAERQGETVGVRVCQGAPSINHHLFADESLLLFKIKNGSAGHLRNNLSLYEDCSGQTINKDKSSIMFSKNTLAETRRGLMTDLEIGSEARNEKYLGLPVYMGRSKTQTFAYLKEKVWKRIQGWKEKCLSGAGKDVLIKAMARAILTYVMSCFDLTTTLCDDIGRTVCRYWWAQ
jgi:hypothetical protein